MLHVRFKTRRDCWWRQVLADPSQTLTPFERDYLLSLEQAYQQPPTHLLEFFAYATYGFATPD